MEVNEDEKGYDINGFFKVDVGIAVNPFQGHLERGIYDSATICSISVQWLAPQSSKLIVGVQISYTAPNPHCYKIMLINYATQGYVNQFIAEDI